MVHVPENLDRLIDYWEQKYKEVELFIYNEAQGTLIQQTIMALKELKIKRSGSWRVT